MLLRCWTLLTCISFWVQLACCRWCSIFSLDLDLVRLSLRVRVRLYNARQGPIQTIALSPTLSPTVTGAVSDSVSVSDALTDWLSLHWLSLTPSDDWRLFTSLGLPSLLLPWFFGFTLVLPFHFGFALWICLWPFLGWLALPVALGLVLGPGLDLGLALVLRSVWLMTVVMPAAMSQGQGPGSGHLSGEYIILYYR